MTEELMWKDCGRCKRCNDIWELRRLDEGYCKSCVPLAEIDRLRERLENLTTAAQDVWNAAKTRTCVHGIGVQYPTHPWFCDDCFHALEDALEAANE